MTKVVMALMLISSLTMSACAVVHDHPGHPVHPARPVTIVPVPVPVPPPPHP